MALKIAKELFDIIYPIGSYYETSNANWSPSGAGWYGTWVEDTKGQTLVGKTDSGTFSTLGADIGEETHKLTTSEMPNHNHQSGYSSFIQVNNQPVAFGTPSGGSAAAYTINGSNVGNATVRSWALLNGAGGSQPHNNIQPSKVCRRWHRTA